MMKFLTNLVTDFSILTIMTKEFLFFLILVSCSPKGYWLTKDTYRAKKPNYQLAKIQFVETNLLSTDFMYLSQDSLVSKLNTLKSAIGFTKNGEAFLSGLNVSNIHLENINKNSTNTAQELGYYRVEGSEILFERLTSSDFGQYVLWKGRIKGDTIIFEQKRWPNPIKEIIYIKSNLPAN